MKFLDMQGAKLPALGFGTWQLEGKTCIGAVQTALDIGYRHIDTAQIYQNEAEVGKAIVNSGIARKELFVTTKLWTTNFAPAQVASSMEESLNKLRMEYVDLLLMHWPNPSVPLADTLHAMQELMRKGKTKAIGVSNFPVRLMREAVEECKAPVACNQVEYHAMLSQQSVLNYAQSHHIIVTAYSPLARGKLNDNPVLISIGKKYGKTPSQIALRWLIEQKDVAAIPKAASEKNARANFDIFDFELSEADRKAIAVLGGNNRLINPDFSPQWDAG
jgi:2,5-diketo-D-gluconate reductase B